jgi:hypothetical protein
LGDSAFSVNNGDNNTGIGVDALGSSATGGFNTAIGIAALFAISGDNNTAIGANALSASNGSDNTAIGLARYLIQPAITTASSPARPSELTPERTFPQGRKLISISEAWVLLAIPLPFASATMRIRRELLSVAFLE